MKKTSKLLSALLLLGQVVGYTPSVLADEEQSTVATEQSATVNTDSSTTDSTDIIKEETTTDSSIEQPEQKPSESTDQTTNSTTDSSQTTESKPETTTSGTTDSSQPENNTQDTTKPSETKPVEQPTTKPSESVNQEVTQPTKPAEVTPSQSVVTQPSTTGQNAQSKAETKAQAQPTVQEESKTYHQAPTSPIQELVPSSKQDNEGNIHFEKNESVESFIRKIGESARKVGQENDLYASVMIAQAILESASGQSQLAQAPNYNLFGIKGTHNGKGVSFATQEDLGNGTLYTTQATFRQYENYEDSLNDYAQLLKEGLTGNSQFYSGVWKTNAKTYQEATKFLTGRYATDTKYNQKLNGLIETYHLTDYDKEVAGPQLSKEGYIVPVKNYTISSPFGTRGGEFHRGIDLAAAQGEPIYASKEGTVVKAEFHPSWGNYVAIEHEDGTTALYAHQQEYQVKMGDKVKQGQIIGYVGSTGNSTGSHLHFELCLDHSLNQSQLVDPETVLF
ncbi:peptidoglycan DD-metalloendopeptidase family protein [Enterococcus faecium]|uniref:peptidoglycan DD-metalloendopeptidase family protein n=2 Tax=Enterococcus faecium TaxID=1352 RepID=UPI0019131353|nr:glucosaminidase domain-containing protein [Enterococcus faecium]MBK5039585.1 peptidoglycan DD-metalloendopeptidase family protein [Enterococcus faecium]MBK5044293.1 peptidoglycan DD-metalloendopeptidase family protein [Enterococcus faecium]MBK5069189.1 peptidoglycan DD-metalloendopeptidase family protein [Enterococcus faecium]MBK5140015.1 peptidoglycan DD-metalloendopeptidase family protein [Enterococcus faecium]MBK5156475.1 peptidoglycan DD-metalloendopeptidase family protein [Enterococcus